MGRKKAATVVKRVPGAIAGATSLAAPPATAPKQTMQVEEHEQDEADDDNDDEEEDDEDDGPPGPPDMLNLLINEYKDRNHGTEPDEQTLKQWTEVLSAGVEDGPGKSDEEEVAWLAWARPLQISTASVAAGDSRNLARRWSPGRCGQLRRDAEVGHIGLFRTFCPREPLGL